MVSPWGQNNETLGFSDVDFLESAFRGKANGLTASSVEGSVE
jgi:hypothetical protein